MAGAGVWVGTTVGVYVGVAAAVGVGEPSRPEFKEQTSPRYHAIPFNHRWNASSAGAHRPALFRKSNEYNAESWVILRGSSPLNRL